MKMDLSDHRMRRLEIVKRLLNYETMSYQKLSQEFFVSRSSLVNDFHAIKKFFQKDDTRLIFSNSGSRFQGGEIQVQQIIKRLLLDSEVNFFFRETFFDNELASNLKKLIEEFSNMYSCVIPEAIIEQLCLSLTILVLRAKTGHYIEEYKHQKLDLARYYPRFWQIITKIEEQAQYNFRPSDLAHVMVILAGSGFSIGENIESIGVDCRKITETLIEQISSSLGIDLNNDKRLNNDLVVHMNQLFLRQSSHTTLINPLMGEILKSYSMLFHQVKYLLKCDDNPQEFGRINSISDDEVGFIVLHIQAAIERVKSQQEVVIVCPNGVGVSSLINARLENLIPNLNEKVMVSKSQLQNLNQDNIAFVISTVPIENFSVPVVIISPLCSKDDYVKILEAYAYYLDQQKALERYQYNVTDFSRQCDIPLHVHKGKVGNIPDIVDFLLTKSGRFNQSEMRTLKESILEREEIQTTYMGNGIAIPHANPRLLSESSVEILILDKPIQWGLEKVEIVALLLVDSNRREKLGMVMNWVVDGIEDKKYLMNTLEYYYV